MKLEICVDSLETLRMINQFHLQNQFQQVVVLNGKKYYETHNLLELVSQQVLVETFQTGIPLKNFLRNDVLALDHELRGRIAKIGSMFD
jgi:hypothetical protein